jgi:hypothetical protein
MQRTLQTAFTIALPYFFHGPAMDVQRLRYLRFPHTLIGLEQDARAHQYPRRIVPAADPFLQSASFFLAKRDAIFQGCHDCCLNVLFARLFDSLARDQFTWLIY